jgi:hypothetical protein
VVTTITVITTAGTGGTGTILIAGTTAMDEYGQSDLPD